MAAEGAVAAGEQVAAPKTTAAGEQVAAEGAVAAGAGELETKKRRTGGKAKAEAETGGKAKAEAETGDKEEEKIIEIAARLLSDPDPVPNHPFAVVMTMKKAKKDEKAKPKAMTASAIIKELAGATQLKPKVVKGIFAQLQAIAYREMDKTKKFVIPKLVTLYEVHKTGTEAGKKMLFGHEMHVKAKPPDWIVKAKPAKEVVWASCCLY